MTEWAPPSAVATAVLCGSAHAATPVTMGFAVSPLALDSSRPSPFGCHARLARGRVAAARVEGRRARGGCLGMVAAAKDCWSMSGANSAMQALMGMGAGVSTEDVCTFRHDDQVWFASVCVFRISDEQSSFIFVFVFMCAYEGVACLKAEVVVNSHKLSMCWVFPCCVHVSISAWVCIYVFVYIY